MNESTDRVAKPFDEIVLGGIQRPHISIEGSHERVLLAPQEFRLLLFLKKARGNLVTNQDMLDIFYGEPDTDLPLTNELERQIISGLREKLEHISNKRFSIKMWQGMGIYLSDKNHPQLQYTDPTTNKESVREKIRASKLENTNRKKK